MHLMSSHDPTVQALQARLDKLRDENKMLRRQLQEVLRDPESAYRKGHDSGYKKAQEDAETAARYWRKLDR